MNLENEDTVEVDLTEETLEIVSHAHEAVSTKTTEEREMDESISYGALPAELRKGRAEIEKHWIAASPDEKHNDSLSEELDAYSRCIIVGTNGQCAFALKCPDSKKAKTEAPVDYSTLSNEEILKKETKASRTYAAVNAAFAYKSATSQLEKNAFFHLSNFEISNVHDQTSALLKVQEFRAIGKTDPSLLASIKRVAPKLSVKVKELPKMARPLPIRSAPRPGNAYASVSLTQASFTQDFCDIDATRDDTTTPFRLMTCRVPSPEKKTGWKESNTVFHCRKGTIPSAAFNETHIAVLFQPSIKDGPLRLHVIELKTYRVERSFDFFFPSVFSREGMLSTSLSEQGVFSVSFASGVLVFDTTRPEDTISVFILSIERQEEDASLVRHVTCTRVRDNLLVFGTDKGECYVIEWRTGDIVAIEHSQAVEPLFSVDYYNKCTVMHTVMGVVIAREKETPVIIDSPRPLAIDMCGTLIFVMTKYGNLQIFKADTRRVVHQIEPVPQKHRIDGIQHAYQGMRAFPEHMVCVYPNGVVRTISLISKK